MSQRKRKRVEEIFGWMKIVGGFRRTRFKGLRCTQLASGGLNGPAQRSRELPEPTQS